MGLDLASLARRLNGSKQEQQEAESPGPPPSLPFEAGARVYGASGWSPFAPIERVVDQLIRSRPSIEERC